MILLSRIIKNILTLQDKRKNKNNLEKKMENINPMHQQLLYILLEMTNFTTVGQNSLKFLLQDL